MICSRALWLQGLSPVWGSCRGTLPGRSRCSTGAGTSPSCASSSRLCSLRRWSPSRGWTTTGTIGKTSAREASLVRTPLYTTDTVHAWWSCGFIRIDIVSYIYLVLSAANGQCSSIGFVVASVCYLQFFPAPSDEKGVFCFLPSFLYFLEMDYTAYRPRRPTKD